MVGVSLAVNCFAVATKLALADPDGIVTEPGTVRFAELDVRLTVAPLEALTVTVHVLDAPGDKVAGTHPTLLTVVPAVARLTVPPVLVMVMPLPVGEAPRPLTRPIVAPLAPDSVTATVAIIPSPMAVAFIPEAMQIYPLAPPAQVTVLPADDNAAPAVTLRLETAAAG